MINRRCIPKTANIIKTFGSKYITTAGVFRSNQEIELNHLCLPEFSFTRRFGKLTFHVFDSPQCPYHLILGQQVLSMAKMKLDFASMETDWLGNKVPFHPWKYFRDNSKLRDLLSNDPVRVKIAESFLDQTSGHYVDNI
jgi:hypothetical protein